MKKISVLSAAASMILTVSLVMTGCSNSAADPDSTPEPTPVPTFSPELAALTKNTVNAVITLDGGDEINLELYPDLAPETVENFVKLANDGVYDGTIFHRVIEGFMIQGGGYDEDLKEIKESPIIGEFTSNGFKNELPHYRGTISMARTTDPDSASSQFFIVQEDSNYLDGEYAAFGRVTDEESMTVVDDIASVRTGTASSLGLSDVPVSPVIIKSITVSSSAARPSAKASDKPETSPSLKTDEDTDAEISPEELKEIMNSLSEGV